MSKSMQASDYDLSDVDQVGELFAARLDELSGLMIKAIEENGVEGGVYGLLGMVLGTHIALDIEVQKLQKRLDALEG